MLTIDALKNFGADTETGLARCMGSEALYLRLAASVVNEKGFDRLKEAIDKGDYDAAFDAAHALKGAVGNLSITPLYDRICVITELLRGKKEADYPAWISELDSLKNEYAGLCAQ